MIKSALTKILRTDVDYLAKNTFWTGGNQIIIGLFSFVTTIVFANFISANTFGTYKFVLSAAAFFAIPTLSGLNTSLVRAIAQGYEGNIVRSIKLKLKWGSIAFFFGLAVGSYYYLQGNYEVAIALLIAAAFTPLLELGSLYLSIIGGRKQFRQQFFLELSIQAFVASILITVILFFNNIIVLIAAYFASWTVGRITLLLIVIKQKRSNDLVSEESVSLGKHLSLIKVTNTIASNMDKIILFNLLGPISVAAYSIAIAPVQQVKSLASIVKTISLPKFSENKNHLTITSYVHKMCIFTAALGTVTVLYFLSAPTLFSILFPEYLSAIEYSQILSIGILFSGFILNGSILIAWNETRHLYIQTSITYFTQIVLTIVTAYYFGIIGVVWSFVFTQFLYFCLSTISVLIVLKKRRF